MKVSIITTVYNGVNTVADTLLSVQQQSYHGVEHIIQDGGSTDGTLAVVEKFADSRCVVESAPDSGIYSGINRAIERASGDIVGLLHSDDVFAHKDVLTNVVRVLEDSSINGVYGDLIYVSRVDTRRSVRFWKSSTFRPEMLRRGWMPPHPTLFLRRDIFANYGKYNPEFRISADYEAVLRWFKEPELKFAYLPEILVRMRLGGESNKSMRHILRKSKEDLQAIRAHKIGGFEVLLAKNFLKVGQFFSIRRRSYDKLKG